MDGVLVAERYNVYDPLMMPNVKWENYKQFRFSGIISSNELFMMKNYEADVYLMWKWCCESSWMELSSSFSSSRLQLIHKLTFWRFSHQENDFYQSISALDRQTEAQRRRIFRIVCDFPFGFRLGNSLKNVIWIQTGSDVTML